MQTFKDIPAGMQDVIIRNALDGSTMVLSTNGEPLVQFTPKSYADDLPSEEQQRAITNAMQAEATAQMDREILNVLTGTIDAQTPSPHRQAEWKQPCKRVAEETKKRRKMAKQSRKINRSNR